MKAKFQTRASRAEEEVLSMLKDEKNIQKPWSMVAFQIENRTLQTTAAEAAIIFNTQASIRPGYEIGEKTAYVPNLFAKLSGTDEAFQVFVNREELKKKEKTFVFDSFEEFPSGGTEEDLFMELLKDGQLDKSVLASAAFRFTFLRREYQELLISKINELINNKQDYFIGQGIEIRDSEIVSCLLGMDESFMQALHNFDFQFQPPAVVIFNKGKEHPGIKQAINLLLLNLLGFDIIVVSAEGHADIENILKPDVYCVLMGENVNVAEPGRKRREMSLIPVVSVFIVVLIFAAIAIGGRINTTKNNVPESQAALNPNAVTDQDQTAASQNEPATNGVELSYSPPSVEEVEPIKPLDTSEKLIFKDPALEKSIRKILEKEIGDILVDELDDLGSIRFIGPYAGGGPDWYFVSGFSPTEYYDTNGAPHREEGDIRDLSDLGKIPGLYSIEASWQREIDINSLKGFQTNTLSLKHSNIGDISSLATMKNLGSLDLGFNYVQDISPIASLQLVSLALNENNVSDISPLINMKSLDFLDICSNPIENTAPLGKLTRLSALIMVNVPVKDFNFLSSLTRLESLNLEGTGLTDLSILKDHTKLTFLNISNNSISDLSVLKDMGRLQHLDISMTNVEDLSVLKDLTSLRTINVFGMRFDDKNEAILSGLKNVDIRR